MRSLPAGQNITLLLVRLMVGLVFMSEGIQKFLFPALRGAGRFMEIGLPWPELLAPAVGAFEVICGLLVLLGWGTRGAAFPLFIVMVTAILTTKLPIITGQPLWDLNVREISQYGWFAMFHEARTDFSMLIGSLILIISGPGDWSVDKLGSQPESVAPWK